MGLLSKRSGIPAAETEPLQTIPIEVIVLFTDVASTLKALRTAAQLAQGLTARIRLLLIETVPYPLPLDEPRRSVQFAGRQFRTVVDQCPFGPTGVPVETVAEVVLCRDAWDGLRTKLPRNSVVVIGRRSRWWPRAENRLARRLRAAGHDVIRTLGVPSLGFLHFVSKGFSHA